MEISPLAGKPAPKNMLVDLARLEREYYERRPDMEDSWSQYLLLCERITKAEKQLIDQARSLHVGENPPEFRMYIRVN